MKLQDVIIDIDKTVGMSFTCVDVKPYYRYENNVRTEDIEGYKYQCVLPERKYETLAVKIKGSKKLELQDEPMAVAFVGLSLKGYIFNGTFMLTAEATDVKLAKN